MFMFTTWSALLTHSKMQKTDSSNLTGVDRAPSAQMPQMFRCLLFVEQSKMLRCLLFVKQSHRSGSRLEMTS